MAQAPALNNDPDAARVVTSDIDRFWEAVDRAADCDPLDQVRAFRDLYLRPASPGLRDWMRLRLSPAEQAAAAQLAQVTAARPRFYAGIRANTLALGMTERVIDSIRACLRHLKALYAEAVFPDLYFLIGRISSAGTVGPAGLLIGAEMLCCNEGTPKDELSDWERASVGAVDRILPTVMHELVHYQRPARRCATLLERALREGGADFIAALVTGTSLGEYGRNLYGVAHESALWAEFSQVMHGTDSSGWLYEGDKIRDRPADLGYFVGLRICQTYYQRACDKRLAVRRIVSLTDPEALLRESGYGAVAAVSA